MHLIKTQNLSLKTTFHMPERNTFFQHYLHQLFFFNFQRYSPNTVLLKTREKSILENYHLSRIFAQVLRWISTRRIYFLHLDWLEKLILQRNISLRRKVGMIYTFSPRNISLQRIIVLVDRPIFFFRPFSAQSFSIYFIVTDCLGF